MVFYSSQLATFQESPESTRAECSERQNHAKQQEKQAGAVSAMDRRSKRKEVRGKLFRATKKGFPAFSHDSTTGT